MAEEESRKNDRAPEAMVWAPLEGELVSVSEASLCGSALSTGRVLQPTDSSVERTLTVCVYCHITKAQCRANIGSGRAAVEVGRAFRYLPLAHRGASPDCQPVLPMRRDRGVLGQSASQMLVTANTEASADGGVQPGGDIFDSLDSEKFCEVFDGF